MYVIPKVAKVYLTHRTMGIGFVVKLRVSNVISLVRYNYRFQDTESAVCQVMIMCWRVGDLPHSFLEERLGCLSPLPDG